MSVTSDNSTLDNEMAPQSSLTAPQTAMPSSLTGSASGPLGIGEHELRSSILGEMHTRPFETMHTPRRVYHFGMMTTRDEAAQSYDLICKLAQSRGVSPPAPSARHHRITIAPWTLRWEQHTEFCSYTWSTEQGTELPIFEASAFDFVGGGSFHPPGHLLVAVRLRLHDGLIANERLENLFDRSSLSIIEAAGGCARVSTDFQVDAAGFTRFLVENRSLADTGAGRLVQRVLELETYRSLALLGVPTARKAGPIVSQLEKRQAELTCAIGSATSIEENRNLLNGLTDLAAKLEAQVAQTSFRFGASRAYNALVYSRLQGMREDEHPGYVSISRFLRRRMKPAMETCNTVNQRQHDLSGKLSRTADLLSTRIQFDLEQQNRELMQSMNRRAALALRLQQTVEGLSIGAISYYVVGLIGYLAKGGKSAGLLPKWLTPEIIAALSVPIVIAAMWYALHHARKSWSKPED